VSDENELDGGHGGPAQNLALCSFADETETPLTYLRTRLFPLTRGSVSDGAMPHSGLSKACSSHSPWTGDCRPPAARDIILPLNGCRRRKALMNFKFVFVTLACDTAPPHVTARKQQGATYQHLPSKIINKRLLLNFC